MLRGDIARLERCTEIMTKGADSNAPVDEDAGGCGSAGGMGSDFAGLSGIRRSKPFKYAYEKEIVM